mmetsp:Transcript_367/g.519  ORF Transcript_367/g.519 Transcript_367/m.519 type:complete len:147 (+) Transcript_367:73-513(+)
MFFKLFVFAFFVSVAFSKTITVTGTDSLKWEADCCGGGSDFKMNQGDIVTFTWGGSVDHNVFVMATPDEGDAWEALGGPATVGESAGTYSYDNFTRGSVSYLCQPHESVGMTGEITVCSTDGNCPASVLVPSFVLALLVFFRLVFV